MTACVIDASAVLCHLFGEHGGDEALDWMDRGAAISTANAQEVIAKLVVRDVLAGTPANDALAVAVEDFDALVLEVQDLTMADAIQAGALAPHQKGQANLSAGDRCCLALAKRLALPIVHAEQKWQPLADELTLELVLVRPPSDPD